VLVEGDRVFPFGNLFGVDLALTARLEET
jgi:hypothetical protein